MASPPSARKERHRATRANAAASTHRRAQRRRLVVAAGVILALLAALAAYRGVTFDPAQRGRAALVAGDARSARVDLTAALQQQPRNPGLHRDLALAQLALGRGAEAERNLRRSVELGMPGAPLAVHIARARLLQGDAAGALASVAAAPPGAAVDLVRGDAFMALGDPASANAAFARAIDSGGGEAAWVALGRLRLAEQDMLGADAAADAALRVRGSGVAARLLKADVVATRGGPVSSLPWYASALEDAPEDVPTLIGFAAALGEAGRAQEAVAQLRRAADLDPGNRRIAYLRAVLAIRGGEPALARALLARGGPGGPGEALLRAAIALSLRDDASARDEAAGALARGPDDRDARRLLAFAVARSGASGDAIALLDPLTVRSDADAWSLLLLSRMAEAYGQPLAAIEPRARASRMGQGGSALLSPATATDRGVGADIARIRAMTKGGNFAGAAAVAARLAQANPGVPQAALVVGDVARARGDLSTAIGAYTRAAELRFDRAAAMRLIEAQLGNGDRRGAEATVAAYLARWPDDASAMRLAGNLATDAGRWADAAAAYAAAVSRLGTNDALLLAQLAQSLIENGRPEEALPHAARAYRLMPMSARTSAVYGRALRRVGDRPRDAEELLRKARQRDPVNALYARWASEAL